jgi:hypothetical protein
MSTEIRRILKKPRHIRKKHLNRNCYEGLLKTYEDDDDGFEE